VTAAGVVYRDFDAGSARTNASGAFTFHRRITRTSGFAAQVEDVIGACPGSVAAPDRCVSMTTSGGAGDPITISVPRR
jgi:hypothetical protein